MTLVNDKNGKEIAITFRLFEEKDAPQVIECIKAEYGSTYFKSSFYNAAFLIKEHKEDIITFIVAETSSGDIAGILGLKSFFPSENMCEIASQIFKKEYRGYHMAMPLFQYGIDIINKRSYYAIYALPVTFHSISQVLLRRFGLVGTGFAFSVFCMDSITTSYSAGKCQKHSQCIQVKALQKTNAGVLYIPDEVADFTNLIYTRLGVKFETAVSPSLLPIAELCTLFHTNDDIQHSCSITIISTGKNLEKELLRIQKLYSGIAEQTFNIFLNINDENAVWAYEILKEHGYFFSGCKPLCSDREYIIMHNPNGVDMCFNDYVLSDEFSELLAYIKEFYKVVQI